MSRFETEASSGATTSRKRRTPNPKYDSVVLELLDGCDQSRAEADAAAEKQFRRELMEDSGRRPDMVMEVPIAPGIKGQISMNDGDDPGVLSTQSQDLSGNTLGTPLTLGTN